LRPLPLDQKDEQVRTVVVGSPSLIVLDNFETIVGEERTRCANWLARLPSCSAVITSRVEVPHAKPINIFAMSPTEAKKFVKLLIQEARNPHSFKGLNLDRIINTTDRNPLVMQWAMKQINRAQQPQTVLEQLAQGEGDAANRVFNRSFNLLSDDGRSALLAVSLFAPSASHQALAEVAGLEKDSERLNKAIGELADLWLIGTTEGNERLIVEGLTRELARAHLAKDARAADFRQRFVVHFQNYVRTHAKPTSEDFDALEAEKDNVLGAMDLAFEMEDWVSVKEMANVLAEPVDGMLRVRGYWDESIRRGEQAASAAEESGDEWGISQFTGNAATIRKDRGEYDEAKQAYERSLAAFRKLNSEENVAVFLHQLAIIAHDQGKLAEARRLYDESLEITRKLGDQRRIAYTLHQLAILAQHQGELAEARRLYDESLEVNKKLGDQGGIAMTLHQLAMLAQGQSDLPEARRLYDESLEIKTKLGDQSGIASTLHQLGRLAENEGDKSEAVRLFNESLIIFEKLGSPNAEIARRSLMRVQGESS
jgi:tetratricopeptide (TPR) repeat protein